MSVAIRTGTKRIAKMSAISALASALAAVGGPVAALLTATVGALLLTLVWVLSDSDRSDRLEKLIQAVRDKPSRPPRDENGNA